MARRAGDIPFNFNDSYGSPINGNFSGDIGFPPLQPNPQTAYPPVPGHAHQHAGFAHHGVGHSKTPGEKRRSTEPQVNSRAMNIEEASRVAAEEDKRRRNTAASARFRVKKKQREAALEKSAKEMQDKVSSLEAKISQLETENQWLKKLILEKNDGTSTSTNKDVSKLTNRAKDEIKVDTGKKTRSAKKDESESDSS